MSELMVGSVISYGDQQWVVKEYGHATEFTGPYPDIHEDMNICLRDLAIRVLQINYDSTRMALRDRDIHLGHYEIIEGPVQRLYMKYDEEGFGVGDPIPDRAMYTFAWRAKGLVAA